MALALNDIRSRSLLGTFRACTCALLPHAGILMCCARTQHAPCREAHCAACPSDALRSPLERLSRRHSNVTLCSLQLAPAALLFAARKRQYREAQCCVFARRSLFAGYVIRGCTYSHTPRALARNCAARDVLCAARTHCIAWHADCDVRRPSAQPFVTHGARESAPCDTSGS
eukprot:4270437-Pleurochrysis_carterae.AAC.3